MTPLAKRLLAARRRSGLTQDQVAYRAGCSQGSVSRYELGLTEPRIGDAYRLARALGVDLTWLATGRYACLPA